MGVEQRIIDGVVDLTVKPLEWHYDRVAKKAATLCIEDLQKEIASRSNKSEEERDALKRSGAVIGGWVVGTAIEPRLGFLAAGPAVLVACLVGPIRGRTRETEIEILRDELKSRYQPRQAGTTLK